MRDILRFHDAKSGNKYFGGKAVVLGGDFLQTLPVVSKGWKEQIVESSINKSALWNYCRGFILTKKWGLNKKNVYNESREFAEWILKIEDGE